MLSLIKRLVSAIKRFFALHYAILKNAQLFLALLLLSLSDLLALNNLFLGLKKRFFLKGLRSTTRFADNVLRFRVCRLNLLFSLADASRLGVAHGYDGATSARDKA